jgi:hypothetical protein
MGNLCWAGATCRRAMPALLSCVVASWCAAFDAAPRPIMPVDQVVLLATTPPYDLRSAMIVAGDWSPASDPTASLRPLQPVNGTAYRNAFIGAQLAAIEARYEQFRLALSAQSKGANFGLEVGVLGLTSGGALAAKGLANALSAGAAGLTGTKAALSKEVYFEKALPALLTSMDARRIEARAPILAGMKQPIEDYPIAQAIADLFAFQNSASLDRAVVQLTAAADADKAEAEVRYENVRNTCRAEKDVGMDWAKLRAGLRRLDPGKDEATLDIISGIVQSDSTPPFVEQRKLIFLKVAERYCSRSEVQGLLAQITTETGVTFP